MVGGSSGRSLTVLVVGSAAALALSTNALAARPTHPAAGRPAAVVTSGYVYARDCPGSGVDDVVDRWKLDECNCTSYVAWALETNGQRTDWFVPGEMDALNWPVVAHAAGLRVDREPALGAVAVWPAAAPPFGHVAYVTGVHGDRYFDVAEYNLPLTLGGSTFGFDTRHGLSTDREVIFIHVPRHPSTPSKRAA